MKKILSLLVLLSSAAVLFAQSAEELKKIDPLYYYELYRPYPVENITEQSPAPKGYTPFYISHLSRHGSRWHTNDKLYNLLQGIFTAAHEAGELTELGERFYNDWNRVCDNAKGRYGELSPAGIAEQRSIAERMYASFPEVFSTKGGRKVKVDCRSTVVPRCIHSMANFALKLTSLAPGIDVAMESSHANDYYLAAYADLNNAKGTSIPYSDSLRRAYSPDPSAFVARLFKPESKVVSEKIGCPKDFMYNMYLGNAVLGANKEVNLFTLGYLFTEEEMAAIWKASNIRRYVLTGHSARYAEVVLNGARPLLRNVIETADRAIAEGDEQATLRFAHDVTMIPFVNLMGIEAGSIITDDYDNVGRYWQNNVVTPMASNVQLIFYRNKAGDILVKVMLCEREQVLVKAVGEPVSGCYYRWADLRKYLINRL